MPVTITLRRTSRASRSCTIRVVPFAPTLSLVQTSAQSALPSKPRSSSPCDATSPFANLEGARCGKHSRTSRTHLHGEWYRPIEETEPDPWAEWRDLGGEG